MEYVGIYLAVLLALVTDRYLVKHLTKLPQIAKVKKEVANNTERNMKMKQSVRNNALKFLERGSK